MNPPDSTPPPSAADATGPGAAGPGAAGSAAAGPGAAGLGATGPGAAGSGAGGSGAVGPAWGGAPAPGFGPDPGFGPAPGFDGRGAGDAPRPARRWWLTGLVVVWAVGLAGAAVWSVRNDPPTVAEQRDIAAAVPLLERATGTALAAADASDRVVEIGPLRFDTDCPVTPARDGVEASREIIVRVRPDQAPGALDAIAEALPAEWKPAVRHLADNTRHALRADAGEFIGLDAAVEDTTTVFALRVSTGCRPTADGVDLNPTPQPAATLPPAFSAAMTALGANAPATSADVKCPDGTTAATVTASGLTLPGDLGRKLQELTGAALVIRAEPQGWAYRVGEVSVVVADGRVSATTSCRQ
ncbi:hypothetical protein [Actinoplanes sp. NPDC051859]|uniref:hypothetical protein n=1 Tax=Actinoplanes sp. NPDC051859 TaxID=3363909 RepID=UPI00379E384A